MAIKIVLVEVSSHGTAVEQWQRWEEIFKQVDIVKDLQRKAREMASKKLEAEGPGLLCQLLETRDLRQALEAATARLRAMAEHAGVL